MGAILKIKKAFSYKIFFVVNIVILALLGLSFGREFVRSSSIEKEMATLESRRSELEDKNLSLVAYQDYLNTEAFLENEAREKFGLQKPGESQVFIEEREAIPVDEVKSSLNLSIFNSKDVSSLELWMWYFFQTKRFNEYTK